MVKLNKIYTRTGDDGTTGLVGGVRIAKSDPRMAAIGDVDEANSAIGVAIVALGARVELPRSSVRPELVEGLETHVLRQAQHEGDEFTDGDDLPKALTRIQNDLFDLGADLATPGDDFTPSDMVLRIVAAQPERIEREIDAMNAGLAPLTSFILPGGSAGGAALHLARAIVRRAERSIVAMNEPVNPQVLIYINRLSDFLFVAARFVNQNAGGDVLWAPGAAR